VPDVLLVDDDPEQIQEMSEYLIRKNIKVSSHTSIQSARNAFVEEPFRFSVALVDVSMPDGNGITLARFIRSMNRDIHVICMSGYHARMPEFRNLVRTFGTDSILLVDKPIPMKMLARTFLSAEPAD
jgi:DNA-binding NtrC family response regulator